MEEIEYLEEYEDFILPNEKNCSRELAPERRSIDSLEGLYKELIGESPEADSISHYTTNLEANVDKTNTLDTETVSASANLNQTPKSVTNSALELQQPLYRAHTSNHQTSFINRATNKSFSTSQSVLQRSDKFKSVATVKPTLQRIISPTKTIRNSKTPLRHATLGQSIYKSSSSTSSPSQSKPKSNVPQKHAAIISNPFQTSVDPLSLEDNSGLLDFDFDKHCLVDDFDFDSDMDNSIIGGISDLDSVDLSDEFSDDNFDLDSDLSSEVLGENKDKKQKIKKQDINLEKGANSLKNKPGPASAKHEFKKDQMKGQQQKTITADKTPSQLSFEKRNEQAAVTNSQSTSSKKDSAAMPAMLRSKQPLIKDVLPKVSPQASINLNESIGKTSPITSNLTGTASPNCSRDSPAVLTSPADNNSSGYVRTYVNKKRLSNSDETATQKLNVSASEDTINKVISDPNRLQSPQRKLEQSNVSTPDKSARMKFGSYLKSIKPPLGKDLIIKKPQQNDKSSGKTDPIVTKSQEIDVSCITDPVVSTTTQNDEPDILQKVDSPVKGPLIVEEPNPKKVCDPIVKINESNTPHKADTTNDRTPQKDEPNMSQKSYADGIKALLIDEPNQSVSEEKISHKEEPHKPQQVEKEPPHKEDSSSSPMQISQTDVSNRSRELDEVIEDPPQKNAAIAKRSPPKEMPNLFEKVDAAIEKPAEKDDISRSQQPKIRKIPEKEAKDEAIQKEEQSRTQTTPQIAKCTEIKQKIMTRRTITESNLSTPSKQSSNDVLDSKTGSPEAQKSTPAHEEKKIKESKDSNTIGKSRRQSLKAQKGQPVNIDKKPSNSGSVETPSVSVQSDEKDSERVVFSTSALQQRRLGLIARERNRLRENIVQKNIPQKESIARENNRLRENIAQKNIPQKESPADKKKTLPQVNQTFCTRLFNIRLDKNAVGKFFWSKESHAITPAQIIPKSAKDQGTENTLKRKMYDEPNVSATNDASEDKVENSIKRRTLVAPKAGPVTPTAKSYTDNIHDKTETSQALMSPKDVSTHTVVETSNESELTSGIVNKTTEKKESKRRKRRYTSWKRKKGIRSRVQAKMSRNSRPSSRPILPTKKVANSGVTNNTIPKDTKSVSQSPTSTDVEGIKKQPPCQPVQAPRQPTRRRVETEIQRTKSRTSLRTKLKKVNTEDKNKELTPPIDIASTHALPEFASNRKAKPTNRTVRDTPNHRATMNESIEAVPEIRPSISVDVTNVSSHAEIPLHVTNKEAEKPRQSVAAAQQSPSRPEVSPKQPPSQPFELLKQAPSRPLRRHLKKMTSDDKTTEPCPQSNFSLPLADASTQNIVSGPTDQNIPNDRTNDIQLNPEVAESNVERCSLSTNISDVNSQVESTVSHVITNTNKEVEQSQQVPSSKCLRRHPRKQQHSEIKTTESCEITFSHPIDTTPTLPPLPVLSGKQENTRNTNVESRVSNMPQKPVDIAISDVEFIQPKSEYIDDNKDYTQFDNCHNNSNNNNADSDITVFELPSFIVMRTKLITSKDINNTYIPPVIKQNFVKLTEERQAPQFLKIERNDFKDVCLEINDLLGQNGNYLKFASSLERLTRMNQVLSDSSLTVLDAQCALKFLQSYLCLGTKEATKEGAVKTKGQQFIPIYDSQKKIIGYRKRTIHKKSHDSSNSRSVSSRMSNMSPRTSSSRINAINNGSCKGSSTVYEKQVVERVIQFEAKKEPQVMDEGDEEIIVPDVEPASEPCIKHESDAILS